jgi:hypothetical protein
MATVIIRHISGSRAGQVDTIDTSAVAEILFGRDEAATVKYDGQRDDLVSRRHAQITWDPAATVFTLSDLSSSNGTFVDQKAVTDSVAVDCGQTVELGPGGPAFEFDLDPRPEASRAKTRIFSLNRPMLAAWTPRWGHPRLDSLRLRLILGTLGLLGVLTITGPILFGEHAVPGRDRALTEVRRPFAAAEPQNAGMGGQRIALIIGNSSYRHIPTLENTGTDAQLIAETATRLGFKLVDSGPLLDLDHRQLETAVQHFSKALQQANLQRRSGKGNDTVALFYYSGHGVQEHGTNYLVPVDANPTKIADFDFQMMDINVVLHQFEETTTALNLVILDACRNNPFGGRNPRGSGGGLAEMNAPAGTLIVFATQSGNVAQDGPSGGNSPFAQALAWGMQLPGVDQFGVFNAVAVQVKKATGGVQQPWMSNSPIEGRFFFLSDHL